MVRCALDDAARERLVTNVVGHLLNGVTERVLERAFEYWSNVDKDLGSKIEAGVRAKAGRRIPRPPSRLTRPAAACRPRPKLPRPQGPGAAADGAPGLPASHKAGRPPVRGPVLRGGTWASGFR